MIAALCVVRVAVMPPRNPTLQGGEVHVTTAVVRLTAAQIASNYLQRGFAAVGSRFAVADIGTSDIDLDAVPFTPRTLLSNATLATRIVSPEGGASFAPLTHSDRPGLDATWSPSPLCAAALAKARSEAENTAKYASWRPSSTSPIVDLTAPRQGQTPPFQAPVPMRAPAPTAVRTPEVATEIANRSRQVVGAIGGAVLFGAALVILASTSKTS